MSFISLLLLKVISGFFFLPPPLPHRFPQGPPPRRCPSVYISLFYLQRCPEILPPAAAAEDWSRESLLLNENYLPPPRRTDALRRKKESWKPSENWRNAASPYSARIRSPFSQRKQIQALVFFATAHRNTIQSNR